MQFHLKADAHRTKWIHEEIIITGVVTAMLPSVNDEKKYYGCSCVGLNAKKLLTREGRDTGTLLVAEVDTRGCLTPQPSPIRGF